MTVRNLRGSDDPAVVDFVDLRRDDRKHSTPRPLIAEGRLCVRQLAASRLSVRTVLVRRDLADEVDSWFGNAVEVIAADPADLRSITGFHFHRGMLASAERPAVRSIEELSEAAPPWCLAPWGVADRENLGVIIRTAAAFGGRRLIISGATADPWARRTVRTSMANVFGCDFHRTNLGGLRRLATSGFRLVAMTTHDATPLPGLRSDGRPIVCLVGEEGRGLPVDVIDICHDRIVIPISADVDSLNVGVAAGIAMHHLATGQTGHRFRSGPEPVPPTPPEAPTPPTPTPPEV